MSYEVSIVADSIGPNGTRITTFQLRYPRMIHAEFMTHRMFSRNASSTRAIPVSKMIEWVERDPVMPVYWGKNQKGMQATQELAAWQIDNAEDIWGKARTNAVASARAMMDLGVHKQIASRILEPWAHINVVVTATDFHNFFALRCHPDAMPEIQVLAVKMARAYRTNVPRLCRAGDWHMPFVDDNDPAELEGLLKFSVARCARVSYLTFEGAPPEPAADIKLHDALLANGHWSPFEHQAQVGLVGLRSGNFKDWVQYRQTLPRSVHREFDWTLLDTTYAERDFVV